MALTRLDCDIYRGRKAASDASAYVALNPLSRPAQMVFAGATAVIQGVGSQVAYKLALDYFVKGILGSYDGDTDKQSAGGSGQAELDDESVSRALEDAFRLANSSIYGFGHKLAAGGRMAASLLGIAVEGAKFAAARVGQGSVYLFRANQLFPLFGAEGVDRAVVGDVPEFCPELASQRGGFLGSHSIVDVEVASVTLQPGDTVTAFSRPLTTLNETLLFQHLEVVSSEGFPEMQPHYQAEQLCIDVFTEPDSLSFACMVCLGPEVIFCSKALRS